MSCAEGRSEILDVEVLVETPRYRLERRTERLPHGVVEARDVVVHPGAAVIVPFLDDGRLLVLEQYRSTLGRFILEFPAGTLELGEDPEVAARRELEEETGYAATTMERLVDFFPAPGITDEHMHVFVARGLRPTAQNLDAGECLEVRTRSLSELREQVRDGTICDGKTILAILHLIVWSPREEEDSR